MTNLLKREIDGLTWKELTDDEKDLFLENAIEFESADNNFRAHKGYMVNFLAYDSYISQEENDDETCYTIGAYKIVGKYVPEEKETRFELEFTTNFDECFEIKIDDEEVIYKSAEKEIDEEDEEEI